MPSLASGAAWRFIESGGGRSCLSHRGRSHGRSHQPGCRRFWGTPSPCSPRMP